MVAILSANASVIGAYSLSPQIVVDITDMVRDASAAFFASFNGRALDLPILHVGDRYLVPVPSVATHSNVPWDDLSRITSWLGCGGCALYSLEVSGGLRIYAVVGPDIRGSMPGVTQTSGKVFTGLDSPWLVIGAGVRYEVVPYEATLLDNLSAVAGERSWIGFRLPAIRNRWVTMSDGFVLENTSVTATAEFYVFNGTERLFAGAEIYVKGSGHWFTAHLIAYSLHDHSIVKVGEIKAALMTNEESLIELPQWVLINPSYGSESRLVVVVRLEGLEPGEEVRLRIYAGGLGRAEIDRFEGVTHFTYSGIGGANTVSGKIGLFRDGDRGSDAVFYTAPIPLINGALSAKVSAEVVGDELEGKSPGIVELGIITPYGEVPLAYAEPAAVGHDEVTGHPLYRVLINASIPPPLIYSTITRYGDLRIYVRVEEPGLWDGNLAYWGIASMDVALSYRAPAVPEPYVLSYLAIDSVTVAGDTSFITSPYAVLDPMLSGWYGVWEGEKEVYSYVTYPAAHYKIYSVGAASPPLPSGLRPPTAGPAPPDCEGLEEGPTYFGMAVFLNPSVVERYLILQASDFDPPDYSGYVDVYLSGEVMTGFTTLSVGGPIGFCSDVSRPYYISFARLGATVKVPPPGSGGSLSLKTYFSSSFTPKRSVCGSFDPFSSVPGWLVNIAALFGGEPASLGVRWGLSYASLTTSPSTYLLLLSRYLILGDEIVHRSWVKGEEAGTYLVWMTGTCPLRAANLTDGPLVDMHYKGAPSPTGGARICVSIAAMDKSIGGLPIVGYAETTSCTKLVPARRV